MKRNALLLAATMAGILSNPVAADDYEFGVTNCVLDDDKKIRPDGCRVKFGGGWKTILWSDLPAYNDQGLTENKEYYVERIEVDYTKNMSVTVYYRFRDKIEVQY